MAYYSAPPSRKRQNNLLTLPLELQLLIMTHLNNIYTLKFLLDAFPDELHPIFRQYSRTILNTIFWRPVRHYSDANGVVYRWMIRELKLGYLFNPDAEEGEGKVDNGGVGGGPIVGKVRDTQKDDGQDTGWFVGRKQRDRLILSDDNDID